MWRAYDSLGFLEYSFVETVEAMHPFYVIRAIGGLLFVIGALLMAYNVWMTIRGDEPVEPAEQPASRGAGPSRGCRIEEADGVKLSSPRKIQFPLLLGILIVVAIGGLFETVPLVLASSTVERVPGVQPDMLLELAGRDIYIREAGYVCHSRMICSFATRLSVTAITASPPKAGHHDPFQWGSKRTGPDLARVGGKYSDEWDLPHI